MIEPNAVVDERKHRLELWGAITALGHDDIEPTWLRQRAVYGGAQGIWVDKDRTRSISPDGRGVTVSFLHTGRHYADELSDDGVIYHYPSTNRPTSRDAGEVQATKNAGTLSLPLFVILPGRKASGRRVKLGWVTDSDDATGSFLILFGDHPPARSTLEDDAPFNLFGEKGTKKAEVTVRPNQQRFRFEVMKQYGSKCAVCPITEPRLLKAAHICGKADLGGDDWRNGLPLCSTHHDAFDAHFFAIHPKTLKVCFAPGTERAAIGIAAVRLETMSSLPHQEALDWRWSDVQTRWT